jgi:hypothetical protein
MGIVIAALVAAFFFGVVLGWASCREQQFDEIVEDKVDEHCEHQMELEDILTQQMRQLDLAGATHEALEKTLKAIQACEQAMRTMISDCPSAKSEQEDVIN